MNTADLKKTSALKFNLSSLMQYTRFIFPIGLIVLMSIMRT